MFGLMDAVMCVERIIDVKVERMGGHLLRIRSTCV